MFPALNMSDERWLNTREKQLGAISGDVRLAAGRKTKPSRVSSSEVKFVSSQSSSEVLWLSPPSFNKNPTPFLVPTWLRKTCLQSGNKAHLCLITLSFYILLATATPHIWKPADDATRTLKGTVQPKIKSLSCQPHDVYKTFLELHNKNIMEAF